MRFRPLSVNYKREALEYEDEQLHGCFSYLPHSSGTYKKCSSRASIVTATEARGRKHADESGQKEEQQRRYRPLPSLSIMIFGTGVDKSPDEQDYSYDEEKNDDEDNVQELLQLGHIYHPWECSLRSIDVQSTLQEFEKCLKPISSLSASGSTNQQKKTEEQDRTNSCALSLLRPLPVSTGTLSRSGKDDAIPESSFQSTVNSLISSTWLESTCITSNHDSSPTLEKQSIESNTTWKQMIYSSLVPSRCTLQHWYDLPNPSSCAAVAAIDRVFAIGDETLEAVKIVSADYDYSCCNVMAHQIMMQDNDQKGCYRRTNRSQGDGKSMTGGMDALPMENHRLRPHRAQDANHDTPFVMNGTTLLEYTP